jgi:hypothetical protein
MRWQKSTSGCGFVRDKETLMPEEQRQILEMLAAKQITIEEADRLLAAVAPAPPPRRDAPPQSRLRDHEHIHQHQPHRSHTTITYGATASDGGAYLREMRAVGLRNLKPHDLIALKSVGVDGAYVRDLQAHGYTSLEPHDLIALKSMGVTGAYLQELRDAGFEHLDPHQLIAFQSHDIDGAYVRRMRAAGFAELAPHDLIALKSQGIDAPDEDFEDATEDATEDAMEEGALGQEAEGADMPGAAPAPDAETVRLLSAADYPGGDPSARPR